MQTSKNSNSQYASKKDDGKETCEKSPCNRLINVLSHNFLRQYFSDKEKPVTISRSERFSSSVSLLC